MTEILKSLLQLIWSSSSTLILIGVVFVCQYVVRRAIWRKRLSSLLPSKKFWFFDVLGDIGKFPFYAFRSGIPVTSYTVKMCATYAKLFQNKQLFCMWVGYEPFVMLVKKDAVKELLTNKKTMDKNWFYKWLTPVLGDGLITSSGMKWKTRRKMMAPCFHSDVLNDFMGVFNESACKLTHRLQEETVKEYSELHTLIMLCSLDVICQTTFGTNIGAFEKNQSQFAVSLTRITEMVTTKMVKLWEWIPFLYSWQSGKEVQKHVNILKGLAKKVIQEKKTELEKGDLEIRPGRHKTLVEMLLEHQMTDEDFTEEDLIEETITFILAGYDTVASSIYWSLYMIGLHPEVQTKIQEELDYVFQNDRSRQVTTQDLSDLHYLDRTLKEAQRLYPAIGLFGRQSNEDIEICGYTIPAKTAIFVIAYMLHRDPEVFPNPEKFDPDRFFPENMSDISPFAYAPFCAGVRNCIGQRYAQMEMKTILSTVLRHFTVESLDPPEKVSPSFEIVLLPRPPLRIRIKSRN